MKLKWKNLDEKRAENKETRKEKGITKITPERIHKDSQRWGQRSAQRSPGSRLHPRIRLPHIAKQKLCEGFVK